jgi:hypothetical protein
MGLKFEVMSKDRLAGKANISTRAKVVFSVLGKVLFQFLSVVVPSLTHAALELRIMRPCRLQQSLYSWQNFVPKRDRFANCKRPGHTHMKVIILVDGLQILECVQSFRLLAALSYLHRPLHTMDRASMFQKNVISTVSFPTFFAENPFDQM